MNFAVALFCVLAVIVTQIGTAQAQCPVSSATCSTFINLSVSQIGDGTCSITGFSNCQAVATASDPCIATLAASIEQDGCSTIDVTTAAICVANAFASAFAEAYLNIDCDSDNGAGCGFVLVEAEALACSFVSALVDLQVIVHGPGATDVTECSVQAEAAADIVASAIASAQVSVCQNGQGSTSAFVSAFSEAIQCGLAFAIARCWVGCGSVTADAIAGVLQCP